MKEQKKIKRINKKIKKYRNKQDRINDKICKLKIKRHGFQCIIDIQELNKRKDHDSN